MVLMKRTFQQPQGKTKFGEQEAGTDPNAPDLYLRSTSEDSSWLIVPRVPTLDMTLEGPGRRLLTSPAAPPRLEATTVPRVATEAAGAAPAAGGGGSLEPKLEPLVRQIALAGVDALIMQDMGAASLVHAIGKGISSYILIHIPSDSQSHIL